MSLRGTMISFAAVAALVAASGSAFAAKQDEAKVVDPVADIIIYDRLVDPITSAIRQALKTAGKEGLFLDKRDQAGVAAYYAEQSYAPSWTADGKLTERARLLIERLAEADEDGLDRSVYQTPPVALGQYAPAGPAESARAEVMLSQAILAYARHAYAGRLDPGKEVSSNFGYEPHLPDPVAVLSNVATSTDPAGTLAAYNPPQEEFARLKKRLAELRTEAKAERPPEVPAGPALKLGMSDPRVPILRARLGLPAEMLTPDLYDETVVAAVMEYQTSTKLKADGIVGPGTLAAMNKPPVDETALVLINMEKWRWMPRYLGRYYVRVNVPDFTVEVYKDGGAIHSTRTVVGQIGWQTPIFSDEIEHIIVNPSWSVPPGIIAKELLPSLRSNPGAIRGYQVFAKVRGKFRAVDPRFINWHSVDARSVQFRQPPGERNALGQVKFMFPNKYAVYLHDTPSKSLFQRDRRALSHGCMRVMDPWDFADVLLSEEPGWNAARLKKLVGGPERRVDMTHHIPVHITYFTAWVDDVGKLEIREDVYGHDKRIAERLGLE
jgi:murein L,D-transpeptidase YcbB/YkuD